MDASDANDTAPNEVPGFGDGPSDEFQDALEVNDADDDDSPVVFRSRSEPEQGISSTSAFQTPQGVFNFDNLLARATQRSRRQLGKKLKLNALDSGSGRTRRRTCGTRSSHTDLAYVKTRR